MALIYIYDATERDKQQLTDALRPTDHHWEYIDGHITPENCNPDTEVISVFVTSKVTREIVDALPRLRLITCRSMGYDNIDLDAAAERGITVVNVPTYGAATVAEYAFALLLSLQRKLPAVFRAVHEPHKSQDLMGTDLSGKTFGVIGTGHIGQKALQIAAGFGMKPIAYDVVQKPELAEKYGFTYVGLSDLLAQADVISLHVPYLPATRHIINAERLAAMKPGAILINTARGELVDTSALLDALSSNQIGGAVLDVIEGETMLDYQEEAALLRSDHATESDLRHGMTLAALEKMPNVILSPHNAYNSIEAVQRINTTTAQNIIDYWYGKTPNQVRPPKRPYGKLLVVRHTESEWNASGRWSGTRDVHLSAKGFKEASQFGKKLASLDIPIDKAFCSEQIRSRETLEGMLNAAQMFNVDITIAPGINERDYGEYTGMNKWQVKEQLGEDVFNDLRRGWDVPVPNGETLKMVYERAVPFYKNTVLPLIQSGKNILIVAHGNSIRALIKYIENISDEGITKLEMMFGQIIIYDVDPHGRSTHKDTVTIEMTPPNA